ncbi:pentatricopeptide repeat-containing protein At1g11900-like isoform X1 [Zingiber officinale]|uniref:pentatricopeptide repeat-containing protein At1g11900-like isoform X1 n=1 Tax=Zingiber officinale TaxID=94328 RepID=UPI001C4AD549|nr:pentatricopeptide repeat-containing protein At1g11900-like isoform X1 [Zingiber officinale]XP_042469946.1 pentatricopeptide repeat-containing protein At1g11900-like isoform X1 [Zingiber officinale]
MATAILSLSRQSFQVLRRMQSRYSRPSFVHHVLWNNMTVSGKHPPLLSITHSITTQEPSRQENVIKDLELFIKSKKDIEAISVKKICTEYIEKLCRSGHLADTAHVFRHLHGGDIKLGLNTYNLLLAGAVEMNNFTLFSEVFKSLLMSKLSPDIISYKKVAQTLERVSDSNVICDFVKDVSDITSCTDCTVINRIIYTAAKLGMIDKSLMIFEVLKNHHLKMDTITFNTVLEILGKGGRTSEMLSEFLVMKDLGHVPDIITYSTLINNLRRFGRLDLCKTIASEISEKGIQLDLLTYTALVDAFGRSGKVEDAFWIFEEMKKFHNPSIYAYRAIISNLKKMGKFELALRLSSEMNLSTTKLAGPEEFKQRRKNRWKIQ